MLRRLVFSDLARLLVIERETQPSPWTPEIFVHCLGDHGCEAYGYEQEGLLSGFVFVSLRLPEEAHLFNLCVIPSAQRQGIGSRLLLHAISIATAANAKVMYLEVRRSNQVALALYHRLGFNQIGERKNYYPCPEGREDAITCAIELGMP